MHTPLRVLIVEDSEDDAILVLRELRAGGYEPLYERVETAAAMKAALRENDWDVVIADYALPHFSGLGALELLQKTGLDLPFIVVSGAIGEETAVEAMKAGAHDYVMKADLTRLPAAVQRELREAEHRRRRQEAEEEVRASARAWQATFDAISDSVALLDPEGIILQCNRATAGLLDKPFQEIVGRPFHRIAYGPRGPSGECPISRARGTLQRETAEVGLGGRWFLASVDPVVAPSGRLTGFVHTMTNITERKAAAQQQALAIRILQALSRSSGQPDAVQKVLVLVREFLQLDAAAIRLQEGDDFPYFATSGLPADFAEAENSLRTRDETGGIVRDPDGNPLIEGMCGNVVCGRTDPSLPCFTQAGSFWTNRASEPIASVSEGDQSVCSRGRCVAEGYESVALIPLRSGDQTIGLLQLNDRRPDRFTLQTIGFFEGIGASIGTALSRARAEQEVRKLSRAVEQSASMVVITNAEGQIEYVNPRFSEVTGYASGEATQMNAVGLGEQPPEEARQMWDTVRSGGVWRGEFHSKKKSGERYWESASISGLKSPDGEITHYVKIAEDITARKRAEDRLQSALRLNQATLATVFSSLLVLDAQLNILLANQRYLQRQGLEHSEVVGHNIVDVFPASFLAEKSLLERLRTVAATGGEDELLAVKHTSSEHPDRYLDIRICGFRVAGDQEDRRVLLAIDDVTEQHALQAQLRQTSKLEAIGTLAGGVAHDFNNILTGIIGCTEVLLTVGAPGSTASRDLKEIRDLAQRAGGLTRQLLAFSRRHPIEPVVLNVNALISDLSQMLGRIIGEDVELQLVLASEVGNVQADPGQIEQVLMNLAVNARDAMPAGGTLAIETGNVVLDQEYADRHVGVAPGPYVLLGVSDTGCGMDKATQERMFDPFFTTKGAGKGTGLGLATVYGIVSQHGGSIWVYSEPGQGATFRIYLPRVDMATHALTAAAAARPAAGGSETILVVEDEETVLRVVQQALEAKGYTVLAAASAGEAEGIFDEHDSEIALLLTDVVLRGMAGPALYERLAAKCASLKVLYMSGYTEHAAVDTGAVASGTPFLPKPFTPAGLAQKVREVLDA